MRKLYCEACGVIKPTPHDDAAQGLFPRRIHGQALIGLICDGCGKEIPKGSKAVAESIPRNMSYWESEYLA